MTCVDRLNRPLQYLRISVTDRCNFRCQYCIPAHIYGADYSFIPSTNLLSFEEIVRLVQIFSRLGVNKVRLTGGEPLVRREIERLVGMITVVDGIEEVTMTTNGSLLAGKVRQLKQAGLSRLNVSVDSLDPQIFHQMNGHRADLETVLKGIRAAEDAGFNPLKINAVIQRGVNDHTLVDLALYFRERGHIVRFIEFMDVGTVNNWYRDHVMSADDMIAALRQKAALNPLPHTENGDVVRRYRYADGHGEVGFITSISHPFCDGCNRLRLSADGKIYTCLFAAQGHDLRRLLRQNATDDSIADEIQQIWQARSDRYSQERTTGEAARSEKIQMFHIGG